ncbi:MAG: phage portal protein, partial [Proteobacteria bacterium]|nr:phage portal protein [Pseudomonadota bacterium]
TLQKAKLDAMHAWAITLEGAGGPGALGPRLGQQSAVGSPQFEKFEAGQNYYLRTGEKIESLASNTPNREYESFTRNTLRLIGAAIGMPYEFMVMDFSTGSYASQRMALLQTHKRLRSYQMWLTRRFLQRVWNWQIAKAIKSGKLAQAPADPTGVSEWYKVDWIYPEFGWADPHREAQKALLEYRMGTNTFSMMAKERGRDPEELLSEKGRDIAKAHAIAQDVNKETGLALTWKDFIEGGGAPGTAATNNGAVEGERRISAPLENE